MVGTRVIRTTAELRNDPYVGWIEVLFQCAQEEGTRKTRHAKVASARGLKYFDCLFWAPSPTMAYDGRASKTLQHLLDFGGIDFTQILRRERFKFVQESRADRWIGEPYDIRKDLGCNFPCIALGCANETEPLYEWNVRNQRLV